MNDDFKVRDRSALFCAFRNVILVSFLIVFINQAIYCQGLLIENISALGWPNGRGDEHLAVDGDQSTFTWTTASMNQSMAHIGISFDTSYTLCRIRLWKDADGGVNGSSFPKDLVIMYTTETGPLYERSWIPVSEMQNGYQGDEFLQATEVIPDGTVSEDIHDSIDEGHGWASLIFSAVEATGVCIQFDNIEGWPNPFVH